ncbi:hypothetical protein [Lactobacillus delbrueckii]|uniref:hypothetical protein n=1 Tax=Lactobacillus delbrueckii TaxID=1584 RepID=UPI001E5D2753|nr:hypothetical protein [Lactobacillus delbrueckii]MCD5456726.1 hypothetical protein [Lactobacillus delbrueckii subsp. bulgaricus]MCD5470760.1 hypothetical protein [Lactobacillus delbrueckii subsp. bulgaricus]MCD5479181.1 hypothetical protein [Lactobacillus delbrueckii subsp. bulgaricus]
MSGDKLTDYLTEQNQKNADYAQKKWQTMDNSLIVHSQAGSGNQVQAHFQQVILFL